MDIFVYDSSFTCIDVIDTYVSFIWAERYCDHGRFEIYSPVNEQLLKYATFDYMNNDYYVMIKESEYVMVIEQVEIKTDFSDGNKIKITGSTVESILNRRIIRNKKTFDDANLIESLQTLVNQNVISASDQKRRIPGIIFTPPTDPSITSLKFTAQYLGENLFAAIKDALAVYDLGFKMLLNDSNMFELQIYKGTDRSFSQNINPYVTFSTKMGNLISSNQVRTITKFRNVAVVEGEGGFLAEEGDMNASGAKRRELFLDASSVSRENESGTEMSDTQYERVLKQKGKEELSKYTRKSTEAFSAEIDTIRTFKYKEDYFLGDILQVVNEYGVETKVRVTEYNIASETSGFKCYPTFTAVMEEE